MFQTVEVKSYLCNTLSVERMNFVGTRLCLRPLMANFICTQLYECVFNAFARVLLVPAMSLYLMGFGRILGFRMTYFGCDSL